MRLFNTSNPANLTVITLLSPYSYFNRVAFAHACLCEWRVAGQVRRGAAKWSCEPFSCVLQNMTTEWGDEVVLSCEAWSNGSLWLQENALVDFQRVEVTCGRSLFELSCPETQRKFLKRCVWDKEFTLLVPHPETAIWMLLITATKTQRGLWSSRHHGYKKTLSKERLRKGHVHS